MEATAAEGAGTSATADLDVKPTLRTATADDLGCSEKERFEMELEFVQALANPNYLNWLAQNRYYEDPAFLRYLEYLQYFQRREYAKYIKFPHCLHFLELLQQPEFRARMARQDFATAVAWQQFYFWLHYRKNRVRDALAAADGAAEGVETGGQGGGQPMDTRA